MLSDPRVMEMEELAAFLESSEALTFRGRPPQENYARVALRHVRCHVGASCRALICLNHSTTRFKLRMVRGTSGARLCRLVSGNLRHQVGASEEGTMLVNRRTVP